MKESPCFLDCASLKKNSYISSKNGIQVPEKSTSEYFFTSFPLVKVYLMSCPRRYIDTFCLFGLISVIGVHTLFYCDHSF